MKTYEKPRLMALSLSGNEQLCGSCADKGAHTLHDDSSLAGELMDFFEFGNKNDGIGKDDFAGVFGNEVQCTQVQIENYCKFTSTGTALVAWS